MQTQTADLASRMEMVKDDYRCHVMQEARAQYHAQQSRLHEVGNKARNPPPCREEGQKWVELVTTDGGRDANSNREVEHTFADYQRRLYNVRTGSCTGDLDIFIRDLLNPTLGKDARALLDRDQTDVEISLALTQLHSQRAWGPNGFQLEFFKCAKSCLVDH
ncbi:hypothetical protein NDU88_004641 [Pleurodeles waltl]|uniref:Uncharacterized protein n=1 Tax=Pleurodeles waltl TaxID=8319 RepID=A0AAV7WW97_PLEWA|nr:hypothetical protein NDU88_004641 [Pleurodeles waltl]